MKIHNPNSQFVCIPDLCAGDVVEPGFLHPEQVTIQEKPEKVPETIWYCVLAKTDGGVLVVEHAPGDDGVWVMQRS